MNFKDDSTFMSSPHHATHEAIKGIAARVAERLGCTGTHIYKMGEDPEKDRYSRFISFWLAIAAEDFEQADIFFNDFKARRDALAPERRAVRTTERKALASVSERIDEVMQGYLKGEADHEIGRAHV